MVWSWVPPCDLCGLVLGVLMWPMWSGLGCPHVTSVVWSLLFSVLVTTWSGHVEKQEMEMENWIGNSCTVVDWTHPNPSFSVGQKLNVLIQPITCSWAWSGILPGVSRGQRSCAYLISCNEKIRRALTRHILNRNQYPALIEAYRTELCHQLRPWSLFVKAYQICTWPLTYTDSRKDK